RPEVGERVDLLLAYRHGARESRVPRGALMTGPLEEGPQPSLQLCDGHAADGGAVQPRELRLVELGRVAAHVLQAKSRDELLGGEDGRVIARPPAEQREVVAHGRGQVTGIAQ